MTQPVLDLSPLRSAIASLDAALVAVGNEAWFSAQSPAIQNTVIAGVIQNFEFVYELSVKMLRRELERGSDSPASIDAANFRDVLRMGAERGLIEDVEAWFHYRQMRNLSAHTYDQAKAWQVFHDLPPFLKDAKAVLARLEARNG
ncbi:MAG: nucleotidyltransferase substrate binding protein [Acetobacteraceae bacterium]|nr:nucleotidyltransferase substrate binding protein [Pseudomonadota bacterium]